MTMHQFIRENKAELTRAIRRALSLNDDTRFSEKEIRLWVMNDESLYNWARSCGVKT